MMAVLMNVNQCTVAQVLEHFSQSQMGDVKVQRAEGQCAEYHCHREGGDSQVGPKFNIQCGYQRAVFTVAKSCRPNGLTV